MQEVMTFTFESNAVRTVVIDGEPWFIAKDVCDVLGISNGRDAVSRLDEDEKHAVGLTDAIGREQPMTAVSESGLYSLVLGSRKPEAKAFKRWITHDVIPSIRKTGSYNVGRMLTRLELIELARESELGRLEAERKNAEYESVIQEQAPKVLFANAVMTSSDSILVRELSKVLKQNGVDIGQNRLFEELRQRGYLIRQKGSDWNMPTQKSMELGLFELKETPIVHASGDVTVSKTPKVTGRGQVYFVERFQKWLVPETV